MSTDDQVLDLTAPVLEPVELDAPPVAAPAHDASGAKIRLPEASGEPARVLAAGGAIAWEEPIDIRTYEAGEPSRYPMYFDHRVYQGSSGRIYPVPFVEHVADEAVVRSWKAVHLENRYLRLVVLPELGGRLHIAYDKTTEYDFFYRNNVIKPALVGLGGPWISGGIEFNWPQHHRPATYLPVATSIEHGPDGSVTVWCGDHDPFARMSAQHGVRLHPDKAVVKLVVRLHNRTSEQQTFLWWANVAARVHDDYQAFFPEDVRYVADHARRAITAYPNADRPYYGVDYSELAAERPGADRIDYYRNILVPTSYMIVDSQQDFFGGYDHAAGAGFVHWAERRYSPGKKLWTWGNAPFGHAWDAQLTDADGPYIELMAGVYTDNQPDFTWILPGETKTFTQYWYPVAGTGAIHQATPDAAVHVERSDRVTARFAVTSTQVGAQMRILVDDQVVASESVDLRPGTAAEISAPGAPEASVAVELRDSTGRLLVRWDPTHVSDEEPSAAEEPPHPDEVDSVDELYLIGMHLTQYRHPTRSPLRYWDEALRRDPGDVRTNLALADRDYRAGRYAEALARIELAFERLTRRNANPADAEAFYLAGLALSRLGRTTEAEAAFGKAGWDGTWAAASGLELARLLARRGRNRAALRVLETLDVTGHDARRTALRVMLLERLGEHGRADELVRAGLEADPLDATLRHLAGTQVPTEGLVLLDVANDLRRAGEAERALEVLDAAAAAPVTPSGNARPMAHYAAAVVLDGLGRTADAAERRERARASELLWAFPNGLDDHDVLRDTLAADERDPVAHMLLGTLLYAHGRRPEALECWESAVDLGMVDPVLFRNAALGAYNVAHDDDRAWARYEDAVRAAPADARLRYEQDQLALRLGHTVEQRLARLTPVEGVVLTRDDLTIEYVQLLVRAGQADRAYEILVNRQFHPWEGGEGRALAAWDETRAALGMPVADPPPSLGEARPQYVPPVAKHEDGVTDYFATSLPDLLLFAREEPVQ